MPRCFLQNISNSPRYLLALQHRGRDYVHVWKINYLLAKVALLSLYQGSIDSIKKRIMRHVLTATRTVIPHHWKSTKVHLLQEWVAEMDHLIRM